MKKRKWLLMAFCFMLTGIFFTFSACNNSESSPSENTVPTLNESGTLKTESKLQNGKSVQHIKKELDKNLIIDADVIMPGKNAYSTYPMTYQSLTAEELTKIFLKDDSSKQTIKKHPSGALNLTTANGTSIFANRLSVVFNKSGKRDSTIDSIFRTYLFKHRKSSDPTKELPFMKLKEAIKKGESVLKSLKLSCKPAAKPIVTAMTGKELENFQTELLKDPDYKNFPKTYVISNWSEKDDAYFIQYTFEKDGLPILSGISELPINMRINDPIPPFPMVSRLLITSEGLRYMDVQQALSPNGKSSTPKTIISIDKAIECLKKCYADIILTKPYTVKKVWLEYISIHDAQTKYENATYTLTPYWCFEIGTDNNNRHNMAQRFNAITGKDLAYGG